jgi:hypothetical protein
VSTSIAASVPGSSARDVVLGLLDLLVLDIPKERGARRRDDGGSRSGKPPMKECRGSHRRVLATALIGQRIVCRDPENG